MKIVIKHRYTGAVLFEHEATEQQASGLAMRAALEAAVEKRANLRGAYLDGAYLRGANLGGANLGGANLDGAYLRGANLGGADLGGANLGGANLGGADLGGANLDGANLRGANLGGADLGGANLGDVNLDGAYLRGANLGGANLGGAYLGGAYLGGKKLVGDRPVLTIGPIGSRSEYLQAYVTDAGVMVRAGCFFGTRDGFEAAVKKTHGDRAHGREYVAALALIDAHARLWTPAKEAA